MFLSARGVHCNAIPMFVVFSTKHNSVSPSLSSWGVFWTQLWHFWLNVLFTYRMHIVYITWWNTSVTISSVKGLFIHNLSAPLRDEYKHTFLGDVIQITVCVSFDWTHCKMSLSVSRRRTALVKPRSHFASRPDWRSWSFLATRKHRLDFSVYILQKD